ncbi:TPA: YukJ family protein [Bacillus pseudomycoides]|nr:YukJ family protein [Bacillus pseudomycoides]
MPVKHYGVLKCTAVESQHGNEEDPHYQVHVVDDDQTNYRIAINEKSEQRPSEILFYHDDNFHHESLSEVKELPFGFTKLIHSQQSKTVALDYVRGRLFDHSKMRVLPLDEQGSNNDLNKTLDLYFKRAINSNAIIYAFGDKWGPEPDTPDKIFGFLPGNGIHDIHMNQGNSPKFQRDDGVFQDGGLLIHFSEEDQWVALFLAFQSQSFNTDDQGHSIKGENEHA